MSRRSSLKMLGVLGLLLASLWFLIAGWPTTPMSVARANRLFGQGLRPGQSRDEVESWLASQGITRPSEYLQGGIKYSVFDRQGKKPLSGYSRLGGGGSRSGARSAGLDEDAVHSLIRIHYPDAARYPFDIVEIYVFLYFDGEGRLLKHWVRESHIVL